MLLMPPAGRSRVTFPLVKFGYYKNWSLKIWDCIEETTNDCSNILNLKTIKGIVERMDNSYQSSTIYYDTHIIAMSVCAVFHSQRTFRTQHLIDLYVRFHAFTFCTLVKKKSIIWVGSNWPHLTSGFSYWDAEAHKDSWEHCATERKETRKPGLVVPGKQ